MKERIKDLFWPVMFVLLLGALFLLPTIARAEVKSTMPIVAAGDDHSLYVDEAGNLFTWGSNIHGQLGTAEFEEIVRPTKTLPGKRVIAISAGSRHSLALTADGELYACGEGIIPAPVAGSKSIGGWNLIMTDVKGISAGSLHSIVLKENGDVYAFGKNSAGALGDGTKTASTKPVKVLSNAIAVEAGGNVSFAVKKNGDLYAWGYGKYGALGTGRTSSSLKPVRIMRSVVSVSTSGRHTLIVKKDGALYGCGQNDFGQLGNAKGKIIAKPVRMAKNIQSASAGWYGSLVVSKSGVLYGCGQIAIPGNYDQDRASQLYSPDGVDHGYDLKKLTRLATDVTSAEFGDYHALFVTEDGSAYSFGGNSWGQLGRGNYKALDGIEEIAFDDADDLPEVPTRLKPLGKLSEVALIEDKTQSYSGEHKIYRFRMLDGTRGTVIAYGRAADLNADLKSGKLMFAHTEEAMVDPLTGDVCGHGAEYIFKDGKTFVTLDESMPAAVFRVRAMAEREGWKSAYEMYVAK